MGLSNLVATFPGLDPMVARKIADHDIDGEAFLMLTQKVRYEQTLVNIQLDLYPMVLIIAIKHNIFSLISRSLRSTKDFFPFFLLQKLHSPFRLLEIELCSIVSNLEGGE